MFRTDPGHGPDPFLSGPTLSGPTLSRCLRNCHNSRTDPFNNSRTDPFRTDPFTFTTLSCWICRPRDIAPTTRISFRVFRLFRGYISSAVTRPVVTAVLKRERDRRILTDGPWIAEPVGGANGDEPVSPVAIATSVAAHPRRSPLAFDKSIMKAVVVDNSVLYAAVHELDVHHQIA